MQKIRILSEQNLRYVLGFIRDLSKVSEGIDNLHLADDKTFSNIYINLLLEQLKEECKDYTDEVASGLTKLTAEVITFEPTLDNTQDKINTILLYSASGDSNYHQWLRLQSELVDLGEATIDISGLLSKTEAENTYTKKTETKAIVDTIGSEALVTTSQTLKGAINECATKSTLTTLTTAEYNTLVSTGSVVVDGKTITFSNDDYYVISDDSSNIDTTKYNIKTFTAIEQLGLTAPVTLGELFNAMPNDSICRIPATIGETTIVSDTPYSYGIVLIDKSYSDRFDIEFKKSHGGTIAGDEKWIGQLKGSDGTGLTWSRVCTTKVADVSKTNISSKITNSSLGSGGGIYYSVKNGICYVQIAGLAASVSGAIILPSGSVPKTNLNYTNGHYPVTSPNATCGLLVFDTFGTVRYYGNSMTIYATISYPVAES